MLNEGFQIEIQEDLLPSEQKTAIDFANKWISETCKKNLVYYLGGRTGGYNSFLRRNSFGFTLDKDKGLVFRRISTRRRVFAVVKTDTLMKNNGGPVDLNQCVCPKHLGSERVVWRNGKPKTFVYAKVGNVGGIE